MGAPFAVRLALVLSLASAQCPPQPPPCVATVGTCGERARPYSDWSSILRLTACGLPLQLRAGIAVSLSGSRASESASQEIVQTLSELAAVQGRGSIQISARDALSYCISFCILDDESSPRKAVEIYRSFVGDYNSSMDLLLGPSTFEFRGAAAQVAEEAIWPMILWSYPSDIGKSAIYNQQPPVAELLQTLASLRTEPRASVVPAPCSGLCEVRQGPQPAENCAQLQLPDTHRPRHLAQFLSCDGPCTDQDLDYCAVRKQVPKLASGCLEGGSGVEETTTQELNFTEDSALHVIVYFVVRTSRRIESSLELAGQAMSPSLQETDSRMVPSDATLRFVSAAGQAANWSVCWRAPCSSWSTCPAWLPLRPDGEFCAESACSTSDVEACCWPRTAQFYSGAVFSTPLRSAVDMVIAPEEWLTDTLSQIRTQTPQLLACIAQTSLDVEGLCRAYLARAQEKGFQIIPGPFLVADNDDIVAALAYLARLKRKPEVVILCLDLVELARFVYGMPAVEMTFSWVVSAFPHGDKLQEIAQDALILDNLLEPTPFPAPNFMEARGLSQTKMANMSVQNLYLHSAVQVGWEAIESAVLFNIAQFAGDHPLEPFRNGVVGVEGLELIQFSSTWPMVDALHQNGFSSYLGSLNFKFTGHRHAIAQQEVSTRNFKALVPVSSITEPLLTRESWQYQQARFQLSNLLHFTSMTPEVLSWEQKLLKLYPCPTGCVERSFQCFPCPPGMMRPSFTSQCVPCDAYGKDRYQDAYAGAVCFSCPSNALCPSQALPPVPKPGFARVPPNQDALAVSTPEACSLEGGLSIVSAAQEQEWARRKALSAWRMHRCYADGVCLGAGACAPLHTGATCSTCLPGSSKIHMFMAFPRCFEVSLGSAWGQTCFVALVQVLMIILLTWANDRSTQDQLCMAGPAVLVLLQTLQIHSVLAYRTVWIRGPADILPMDFYNVAFWSVCSGFITGPCLLPLSAYNNPLATEADLGAHEVAIIFSGLVPCVLAVLAGFGWRLNFHQLAGLAFASLQLAWPMVLFHLLELNRCRNFMLDTGPSGKRVLAVNTDIECPAELQKAVVIMAFFLLLILGECILLRKYVYPFVHYVHVSQKFGLTYQRLLRGRSLWKFVDDLRIFLITAFVILEPFVIAYFILAEELIYIALLYTFSPYTPQRHNCVNIVKKNMSRTVAGLCIYLGSKAMFGSLISDEVLDYVDMGVCFITFLDVMAETLSIVVHDEINDPDVRPHREEASVRVMYRLTRCLRKKDYMLNVKDPGMEVEAKHMPKKARLQQLDAVRLAFRFIMREEKDDKFRIEECLWLLQDALTHANTSRRLQHFEFFKDVLPEGLKYSISIHDWLSAMEDLTTRSVQQLPGRKWLATTQFDDDFDFDLGSILGFDSSSEQGEDSDDSNGKPAEEAEHVKKGKKHAPKFVYQPNKGGDHWDLEDEQDLQEILAKVQKLQEAVSDLESQANKMGDGLWLRRGNNAYTMQKILLMQDGAMSLQQALSGSMAVKNLPDRDKEQRLTMLAIALQKKISSWTFRPRRKAGKITDTQIKLADKVEVAEVDQDWDIFENYELSQQRSARASSKLAGKTKKAKLIPFSFHKDFTGEDPVRDILPHLDRLSDPEPKTSKTPPTSPGQAAQGDTDTDEEDDAK